MLTLLSARVGWDGLLRSLPLEIFYDSLFPLLLNNLEITDRTGKVIPGNFKVRALS